MVRTTDISFHPFGRGGDRVGAAVGQSRGSHPRRSMGVGSVGGAACAGSRGDQPGLVAEGQRNLRLWWKRWRARRMKGETKIRTDLVALAVRMFPDPEPRP
jgi:hypothetical protein